MSLRRNVLFVVPVMLGCWTLKPADEVPDAGPDAARSDVRADVAPGDDVNDASQQDLASMDAGRFDGGMDAGPSDVPMDAGRFDVRMDAGPSDVPMDAGPSDVLMDAGRFDVRMDVAPVDAPDVIVPVDVPPVIPTGLRLISPPGLSTVGDRQPTLRWSGDVAGIQLRLCRDRACVDVAYAALVNGSRHEVTTPLAAGVYFWNLRRTNPAMTITPTWQLRVPNVTGRRPGAPAGVSHRDMDNDGFVDIALGAPGGTSTNAPGAVQVHFGAASLSETPGLTRLGPTGTNGLGYGWSLAWGDFNRDNRADLVVGIFDPARNPQGRIETLRSDGRTFTVGPVINAANVTPPFFFPTSMATGDLNGDGHDDLAASVVGGVGQVQIHLGGSGGLASLPTALIPNPLARPSAFGAATAVLGDIDGDGFGDLLVSDGCDPPANTSDPPLCQPTARGRLNIFFGREFWALSDPLSVTIEGDATWRLGRAVAPAGDLNNDGYGDFIASGTNDIDEASSGVVHLYYGRPRMLWSPAVRPSASLYGPPGAEMLGASVAAADVNRDGMTDILVGAPGRETNAANYQGGALVWLANSADGFEPPMSRAPPDNLGGLYGQIVSAPGDVNGDGFGEVLVTAPLSPARSSARGQAYLWASPAARFPATSPSLTIPGTSLAGGLGRGATR
jgi:hypothetical protein